MNSATLAKRVLAALLVAGLVLFGLERWLVHGEAKAEAAAVAARPSPVVEPLPPAVRAVLGFELAAARGPVLLAPRLDAVPPDVAPCVQVLPDGSVVLRRPPPLAAAPVPTLPAAPADAAGAAVLLPVDRIEALQPAARLALLELLRALLPERPVALERVRCVAIGASTEQLAYLLSWLP